MLHTEALLQQPAARLGQIDEAGTGEACFFPINRLTVVPTSRKLLMASNWRAS